MRDKALPLCAILLILLAAFAQAEDYPDFVEAGKPGVFIWNGCISPDEDLVDEEQANLINELILPDTMQNYSGIYGLQFPNLISYTVPANSDFLTTIDGVLYTKDMKCLISYPQGKETEVFHVPEEVTWIGEYAFAGNPYIQEVVFSSRLVYIDEWAFYECSALKHCRWGSAIEHIGNHAFENCNSYCIFEAPESLKVIGYRAFYNSGLCSVRLNSSIICILAEALYTGNFNDQIIFIPSSLTYIDRTTFSPDEEITILYIATNPIISTQLSRMDGVTRLIVTDQ